LFDVRGPAVSLETTAQLAQCFAPPGFNVVFGYTEDDGKLANAEVCEVAQDQEVAMGSFEGAQGTPNLLVLLAAVVGLLRRWGGPERGVELGFVRRFGRQGGRRGILTAEATHEPEFDLGTEFAGTCATPGRV
jgi:hypothetical protein